MELLSSAILFLGLIFDVIILLFIMLSILLIYSLLMVSVETKTFEFGVMRMVGMTHQGIINMIVFQSFIFMLPSLISGFSLSIPTLFLVYKYVLSDMDLDIEEVPLPSNFAICQALVVGFFMPLVASIAPIQSALSKNLNDSLDLHRSKQ